MARLLAMAADRLLTAKRARMYAAATIVAFGLVYSFGVATRRGLIDGFGHVIGGDLLALRTAANMVMNGEGYRLYDFAAQQAYQQAAVGPEPLPGLNPFITPPYIVALFIPLTYLPHWAAFAAWTAFSAACIVASLGLLGLVYPKVRSHWRFACLLSFSFFPVIEGLFAGNTHALSVLILTSVFVLLKQNRPAAAGMTLGLLLVKPQLALTALAVLVWKRQHRALAGFIAGAAIWVGVAVSLVGGTSLLQYVRLAPNLTKLAFVEGFPCYLMSSLYALFFVPFGPDLLPLAMVLGSACALVALCVLLHAWRGPWDPQSSEFDPRFAALLVATPLVSPYVLLHDLSILIPVGAIVASRWPGDFDAEYGGLGRLLCALVWLVCLLGPLVAELYACL